jgi:hypothetical protein
MSDELQQEIDETREHLGETVDALTAKFDVKSRAKDSLAEADKRKLGLVTALVVLASVAALVLWRRRG